VSPYRRRMYRSALPKIRMSMITPMTKITIIIP
jgi:hypothetical protein